jgi:prepilin-type N-terminal cleavage/methylation domain-containing protein
MVLERAPGTVLSRKRQAGFTILELLVALAVMSVGIWVFLSFYSSAAAMNRTSNNRSVATQIAREQLQLIQQAPQDFQWHLPEAASHDPFPIQVSAEDPKLGNPVAPPAAMPVARRALARESKLYDDYRWVAFGRVPEAAAPAEGQPAAPELQYYEVTVVVHWKEANRPQSVALTSSVPRFAVGGSA